MPSRNPGKLPSDAASNITSVASSGRTTTRRKDVKIKRSQSSDSLSDVENAKQQRKPTSATTKHAKDGDLQAHSNSSLTVDAQLLRSMASVFAESNAIVLVAYHVLYMRQAEDATGAQLLRALGAKSFLAARAAPAPRVLCFTVKRSRNQDQGFRPSLHLIEPLDEDTYSIRNSWPCSDIQEVNIVNKKVDPDGADVQVMDIKLASAVGDLPVAASRPGLATSSARSAAGLGSVGLPPLGFTKSDQLIAFLAVLFQLLKQCGHPPPQLFGSGVQEAAVQMWCSTHGPGYVSQLGKFAEDVLQVATVAQEQAADNGPNQQQQYHVLVSAKEEKEVEELLTKFSMGLGDVTEFEARLTTELQTLETQNIQHILTNEAMVDNVMAQLKRAAVVLEEIDETLQVFDTKLRHMKQDIGAIERYNNTLEVTARNNAKLLTCLKALLSDLRMSQDMRDTLENPGFDKEKLSTVLKPGWLLVKKLSKLTPGKPSSLHPHLMQMRVVKEAQIEMERLSKTFVTKAAAYLTAKINQGVDDLAQDLSKVTDKLTKTQPPDHGKLVALRSKLSELLQLVHALDPAATTSGVRDTYARAVNMLLRKEVRAACSELRKAVALDVHQYPMEFGLSKDTKKSAGVGMGMSGTTWGGSEGASLTSDSVDAGPSGHQNQGMMHRRRSSGGGGPVSTLLGRPGPSSTISKVSRSTAGTALSLPLSWARRAVGGIGSGDVGTHLSLPLAEAWSCLLEGWLPFLLSELQEAAAFLILYNTQQDSQFTTNPAKPQPESKDMEGSTLSSSAAHVLDQLLLGIEPELQLLVDACSKSSQQVLALPMLAVTTWWLRQLLPSPEALPLLKALSACHVRLRAQVAAYRTAQLQALEMYTSKASAGVKSLHVLAFISQFALLSHCLEELQANTPQAAQLMEEQQGTQTSNTLKIAALSSGPPGLSTTGIVSESSRAAAAQAQAELGLRIKDAASWQCRTEMDELYQSLLAAMFSVLERMAGMDPKHGQRLRLENYAYFTESVRPLLGPVPALAPYLSQAQDRQAEALSAYIQQQLEHAELWRVLEFGTKASKLLEVVRPAELSFQTGFSVNDVKALLQSSLKEPSKQLSEMAGRVRRHLGTSSLALKVWEATQKELLTRYEQVAGLLQQCYPGGKIALSPSLAALKDMLQGVSVVA